VFNVQLVSWGSWIDIWPDRQLLMQKMESSLNSLSADVPSLNTLPIPVFYLALSSYLCCARNTGTGSGKGSDVITITYDKGQGRRHHLALVLQDYLEYKQHE
jgi:hypothetical protein